MRRAGSLGVALAVAIAVAAPGARDQEPAAPPRAAITYRLEPVVAASFPKTYTPAQAALLEKLNRRDVEHLLRLKEMIVPSEWRVADAEELDYSPLPATWPWAESHAKAIVVSQPEQVFGAYEAGRLVRWGPVSSGRRNRDAARRLRAHVEDAEPAQYRQPGLAARVVLQFHQPPRDFIPQVRAAGVRRQSCVRAAARTRRAVAVRMGRAVEDQQGRTRRAPAGIDGRDSRRVRPRQTRALDQARLVGGAAAVASRRSVALTRVLPSKFQELHYE
jgi:hypothetical protein